MMKWRPSHTPALEDWSTVHQLVLPRKRRIEVRRMAHKIPMRGHLGVYKKYERIVKNFYWPGIRGDVLDHCRT